MLLGIRWKAKVGGFVSLLILFLAHKFQIARRKFRFGFYIFQMAFSYVPSFLSCLFMQMHEKCHDYRVFVFFLTRSCSASMLDVVYLDMSDPALTSWVVSTHKLLHILAYVWVLHVRRVCGLIIEMVPQGDVSPTSQTLSFILVVSGALPLPSPLSLALFPCCLSLFILYVKFVYSYVKVFARHMNRAVGMFTNREDCCESKRKEKRRYL